MKNSRAAALVIAVLLVIAFVLMNAWAIVLLLAGGFVWANVWAGEKADGVGKRHVMAAEGSAAQRRENASADGAGEMAAAAASVRQDKDAPQTAHKASEGTAARVVRETDEAGAAIAGEATAAVVDLVSSAKGSAQSHLSRARDGFFPMRAWHWMCYASKAA